MCFISNIVMMAPSVVILFILFLLGQISAKSPNLLLFLTDDQDLVLSDWIAVGRTKDLVGDHGIHFVNAFATTPVCCPNRASILTGRYLHNHRTINNTVEGNCSSRAWQQNFEPHTYASILKNLAGYRTFYAGKYLNRYGKENGGGIEHVPDGWDWWNGLAGNSVYYNYTLSINGTVEKHGSDPHTDYLTDVINRKAATFLHQWNPNDGPFLATLSFPACHAPFTPHPRHSNNFTNLRAPRTPNFGLGDRQDKHWIVRINPKDLPTKVIDEIDEVYRNRLRTMLAVDETVENILGILESKHQLENTFVFFTSDHGFHLGQFAQPWDKRQPYDTDIRVPLLVRGPGILGNQTRSEVVLTLDLAQTLIELGGIKQTPVEMDGRSLVPLLFQNSSGANWRTKFLVEYRGEGERKDIPGCPQYSQDHMECYDIADGFCTCQDASNNTYDCIRTLNSKESSLYCSFEDSENFEEYYDLRNDTWALTNLAHRVSTGRHRNLLQRLKNCRQNECHSGSYHVSSNNV